MIPEQHSAKLHKDGKETSQSCPPSGRLTESDQMVRRIADSNFEEAGSILPPTTVEYSPLTQKMAKFEITANY